MTLDWVDSGRFPSGGGRVVEMSMIKAILEKISHQKLGWLKPQLGNLWTGVCRH